MEKEDLQQIFSEFNEKLSDLEKTVNESSGKLKEMSSALETLRSDLELFAEISEQKDRIEFMRKCLKEEGMDMKKCSARWEELQKKYAKPYEKPYGKPGGQTEEQYPPPVIAKVLKYLKPRVPDRVFRHVVRLLGAKEETEEIEKIVEEIKVDEESLSKTLDFLKKETTESVFNRIVGYFGLFEEEVEEEKLKAVLPTAESLAETHEQMVKDTYEYLMKERTWGEEVVSE